MSPLLRQDLEVKGQHVYEVGSRPSGSRDSHGRFVSRQIWVGCGADHKTAQMFAASPLLYRALERVRNHWTFRLLPWDLRVGIDHALRRAQNPFEIAEPQPCKKPATTTPTSAASRRAKRQRARRRGSNGPKKPKISSADSLKIESTSTEPFPATAA